MTIRLNSFHRTPEGATVSLKEKVAQYSLYLPPSVWTISDRLWTTSQWF